jgi:TP901 family phage tail tape measure protein
MANLNAVQVVFNAIDNITAPVRAMALSMRQVAGVGMVQTQAAFQNATNQTRRFSDGLNAVGGAATQTGGMIAAGLGVPIIGLGREMINTAGAFQLSMNRLKSISGASVKEMDLMSKKARELGASTSFSASEAADAMIFLAQGGFNTKQVLDSITPTLHLAAAEQMDLARAADITSSILNGYALKAEQTARVADVLIATAQGSNASVEGLGSAFENVGPIAASAGIAFEDTAAAIGLLGNAGIKGEKAGTALRNAVLRINSDTKDAKETLKKLKINRGDLVDEKGNLKSFKLLFETFKKAGASALDLSKIFGDEAGPAIVAAMSNSTAQVAELERKIKNAAGSTKTAADAMSAGIVGQVGEMSSAFEELILVIADSGILQIMTDLIKSVKGFFEWVAKLNPALIKWTVLAMALGAALGAVILTMGLIAMSVANLIAIWPLLVGAWSTLTVTIIPTLIAGLSTLAAAAIPAVIAAFQAVSIAIMNIPVIGWIIAIIAAVIALAVVVYKNWEPISAFFEDLWIGLVYGFEQVIAKVKEFAATAEKFVPDWVKDLVSGGSAKFESTETAAVDANRAATNGRIRADVNFNGAPAGTTIRSESSGNVALNVGTGLLGR